MDDTERIAEWLEYELAGDAIVGVWSDDVLTIGMPTGSRFCVFDPATDITLWHGDDGLFKKIDEKGLRYKFMRQLDKGLSYNQRAIGELGGMWIGLAASPPQLTSALVAVIEDES